MRLSLVRTLALALPLGLAACATGGDVPGQSAPEKLTPRQVITDGRHAPTVLGDALVDAAPTRLAFSLRQPDEAGLEKLIADQQNPRSPSFHKWLTPAQFGERFGVSRESYARIVSWLEAGGFTVTQYPNRLFLEATATVAHVRNVLGVQLREATQNGRAFHSYGEALTMPSDVAPLVLKVGGLDTRLHLRHRMDVKFDGQNLQVLDADDLRTQYDIPSTGAGASGLALVVLGTQEGTQQNQNSQPKAPFIPPDKASIQTYLTSLAHATAVYTPIVLPNTDDFDYAGANGEYMLDVEMQSVGAPNAATLNLVLSPSSVVFQTGAQYIANTLSSAVVVSTSLGLCESEEVSGDGGTANPTSDASLMRAAVQQGLSEGQTWFAASGDSGADDCADSESGTDNGFGGKNATVDFPCSLPEILCVGGTEFEGAGTWSSSGALTAYVTEETCNEGAQGVAGGGGQSLLYAKPTWQTGVGPHATDGQRDVPDIALIAASNTPGVVDYDCGEGQDSCPDAGTGLPGLDIIGGTSVASPLAAGIFANLAGTVGCKLGDIHPTIYTLGAAQQSGGAAPFHDITKGNNNYVDPANKTITGFEAVAGYDLATGWGSVDVAKLIAAWPACSATLGDGGVLVHDAATAGDAAAPGDATVVVVTPDGATPSDTGTTTTPDTGVVVGTPDTGIIVVTPDAATFHFPDAGTVTDGALASSDAGDGGTGEVSSGGGCSAGKGPAETPAGFFYGFLTLGFALVRSKRRRA